MGRIRYKSNTLDLVFTNEKGMVEDIVYERTLGKSDHSVFIITRHYVLWEGLSDLNIDPTDPKSRLTDSDREKADVL